MRADNSITPANDDKAVDRFNKPRRPGDYVVSPLYVRNSTTAYAAYFLDWFVTLPPELIEQVVECGLEEGGWIYEVEHFKSQCEADVDDDENDLGYWPLEDNGPWVYGDVPAIDVARLVQAHTLNWTVEDFKFYGFTVKQMADLQNHINQVGARLNLPKRK